MDFWAETVNLNLLTQKRLLNMLPEDTRKNAKLYYNRMCGMATNMVLFVSDSAD
jgi:hypothetical protein